MCRFFLQRLYKNHRLRQTAEPISFSFYELEILVLVAAFAPAAFGGACSNNCGSNSKLFNFNKWFFINSFHIPLPPLYCRNCLNLTVGNHWNIYCLAVNNRINSIAYIGASPYRSTCSYCNQILRAVNV